MNVLVAPQHGLADLVADTVAHWLQGGGDLGLAGGGTPRPAYEALRTRALPWEHIDLWLSDERWVPLDHPDSNGGMAKLTLADHVPARFHPVTYGPDPAEAAAQYAARLSTFMDVSDSGLEPDVVLLGLGDDGHTASLFPGSDAVQVTDADYVATWVDARDTWRLTATRPLLARAGHVAFIVAGAAKAPVVASIVEDGAPYPAGLVADEALEVTWFLDEPAASALSDHSRLVHGETP